MSYTTINVLVVTMHTIIIYTSALKTTTLSRWLTMHLASGGPKQHALEKHNLTLTGDDLVNNTKIFFNEFNHNILAIMEALLIRKLQPCINNQSTGINRTLQLFTSSAPTVAVLSSPLFSFTLYLQPVISPLPSR